MSIDPSTLARAAQALQDADGLVITAGAGMGVDSGLPDFRGNEGFWEAYPALRESGIDFVKSANPQRFRDSPDTAWGFYGHRLSLYRRTRPHFGFSILKHWGEAMQHKYFVVTSNVDGQFQKAGFDPSRVAEVHGSIHALQCLEGCTDDVWSAGDFEPEVDAARCLLRSRPPKCPHCGALARPNILMFGDDLWNGDRYERKLGEMHRWRMGAKRPVIVELGAGTAISTVRSYGDRSAGTLIRINVREPRVNWPKDVSIEASALDALLQLSQHMGASAPGGLLRAPC